MTDGGLDNHVYRMGLQPGLEGVGEFDYSSSKRKSNDFLIDLIDNYTLDYRIKQFY